MPTLPEHENPAEIYYNEKESKKYHNNTRITKIQAELSNRAIELLNIEEKAPLILDLGCGSGLSGKVLSSGGYKCVGVDIAPEMLKIAQKDDIFGYGLLCCDIGQELPFKDDIFDYAISISAVQWLFQSFRKDHDTQKRIHTFFRSLYESIKKRAVLQFYCSKKEIEILKKEALRAGFSGGIVIDNENTRNSKIFLVLSKHMIKLNIDKKEPPTKKAYKRAKVE